MTVAGWIPEVVAKLSCIERFELAPWFVADDERTEMCMFASIGPLGFPAF